MDIGDYRHIIVTYTWEPPNEGQARFVLEEPVRTYVLPKYDGVVSSAIAVFYKHIGMLIGDIIFILYY